MRDTPSRYRIVKHLAATFDVTLGPLALIGVCLLVVELLIRLASPWNLIVYASQVAIWAIFGVAFALELSLAPKKRLYIRRNLAAGNRAVRAGAEDPPARAVAAVPALG